MYDDVMQQTCAEEIRKSFGENDAKRDEELRDPDDVIRYDDITYADVDPIQVLDVYRPKDAVNEDGTLVKLPVIINVHGGAWVYGSKEIYQYYCMSLAQNGFAVVNYSYRLAPEHKYPAAIEDLDSVLRFVVAHQEEYGLDVSNVFGVGDSAGGQILASYCCMAEDETYAQTALGSMQNEIKFKAVGLNCGKYRMYELPEDANSNTLMLLDCILDEVTDEKRNLLSPILYMNLNFPNTYLMSCEGDFLAEEYEVMKKKLNELEITHKTNFLGNKNKPLFHVFHCDIRLQIARELNRDECAFFKSFI